MTEFWTSRHSKNNIFSCSHLKSVRFEADLASFQCQTPSRTAILATFCTPATRYLKKEVKHFFKIDEGNIFLLHFPSTRTATIFPSMISVITNQRFSRKLNFLNSLSATLVGFLSVDIGRKNGFSLLRLTNQMSQNCAIHPSFTRTALTTGFFSGIHNLHHFFLQMNQIFFSLRSIFHP